MQSVILAAGKGTRLKARTDNRPKAMLNIGGKSLLEYSLESLVQNGITDVIIVVGFCHETITKRFGTRYRGLKIEYVINNNYAGSGSMYSFSLVKDIIDDEILLMESDLLYESRAIDILLNGSRPNAILVTKPSGSGDEVYICTNDNMEITELGKNIPESSKKRAVGELAGISKFQRQFLELVFRKAQEDFKKGEFNHHYEECVFRTSKCTTPVYAELAKDLAWIEIDSEEDLQKARELIYPLVKEKSNQRQSLCF